LPYDTEPQESQDRELVIDMVWHHGNAPSQWCDRGTLYPIWGGGITRTLEVHDQPLPPRCKRSSGPKPFPGLTRKPPCAACEQAHAHGPQPPGCPPPRIVSTRGRPRQVDTSFHFCPNAHCAYRGW